MNPDIIKIAGLFIVAFLIVMIPIFLGQRGGMAHIKKSPDLAEAPIGTVVAASLGLLAFFLAFIFQIATNRYDNRKELLLEEVTNIRTLYLRAGLIPEPVCTDSRKLLVEFVDLHIIIANDTSFMGPGLQRMNQILDNLWEFAEKLAAEDRSSEVYSLYTGSVNDIINNFNKRITWTFDYRFPASVLWILFIIAFFCMLSLGYQFGITGKGGLRINIVVAVIFAVVMVLVLALDRPDTGMAKLNQKPMITLQKQLKAYQL